MAYAIQHEKPKLQSIANAPVVQYLINLSFRIFKSPSPLKNSANCGGAGQGKSDLIAKRRQQLDKLDELIKARFVEIS